MKKAKTIMAFLTAMTMTAGAMGVTAYAEETTLAVSQTAETAKSVTGLTYEIDDPDYKAEIDTFYDYAPLENLLIKQLNSAVDNPVLNNAPHEEKWYYKHVYIDTPDFEIEHRAPTELSTNKVYTAQSLQLTVEQGRADEIEERDGKVRKFNVADIYWSILVSEKELDLDEINAFIKEQGFKSNVGKVTDKQFALRFDDDDFTTEEVLKTLVALNEKFGIIPGTVAYENGTYDLYYDSAYKGERTNSTWTAPDPDSYNVVPKFVRPDDDGVLHDGLEYHYDPATNGVFIDGDGVFTKEDMEFVHNNLNITDDNSMLIAPLKYIIYGKDVKLEVDYIKDGVPVYNRGLRIETDKRHHFGVYAYINSDAEAKFNQLIEYFASEGESDNYVINLLDADTDPYAILHQTFSELSETEEPTSVKKSEISDLNEKTVKSTLKGDADVNNEVNLADLTKVAKYNLNNEAYPLANEVAEANADMNGDGVVDGLDTSALIENQLGKQAANLS